MVAAISQHLSSPSPPPSPLGFQCGAQRNTHRGIPLLGKIRSLQGGHSGLTTCYGTRRKAWPKTKGWGVSHCVQAHLGLIIRDLEVNKGTLVLWPTYPALLQERGTGLGRSGGHNRILGSRATGVAKGNSFQTQPLRVCSVNAPKDGDMRCPHARP